jgi:hypothetical protein
MCSFLAQKKHYFVPIFITYFGQNKIRNKNKQYIFIPKIALSLQSKIVPNYCFIWDKNKK